MDKLYFYIPRGVETDSYFLSMIKSKVETKFAFNLDIIFGCKCSIVYDSHISIQSVSQTFSCRQNI